MSRSTCSQIGLKLCQQLTWTQLGSVDKVRGCRMGGLLFLVPFHTLLSGSNTQSSCLSSCKFPSVSSNWNTSLVVVCLQKWGCLTVLTHHLHHLSRGFKHLCSLDSCCCFLLKTWDNWSTWEPELLGLKTAVGGTRDFQYRCTVMFRWEHKGTQLPLPLSHSLSLSLTHTHTHTSYHLILSFILSFILRNILFC